MIPSIMFQKSTGIRVLANIFMISGVCKGDRRVAIAVRVMLSATFAFVRKDMTLEAKPLGLAPTSKIPADISMGKWKIEININATMVYL